MLKTLNCKENGFQLIPDTIKRFIEKHEWYSSVKVQTKLMKTKPIQEKYNQP